jgi:DNA mismatch endonuclease (patch repair protein)
MRLVVRTTHETDKARSAQMALIKVRDTKPELKVRRAIHAAGLHIPRQSGCDERVNPLDCRRSLLYLLNAEDLAGQTDLVFRAQRIAVFVHGCFGHQHPVPSCKLARMPKSKLQFWRPKLEGNRRRDLGTLSELEARGWSVLEVWECQTSADELEMLVKKIKSVPSAASSGMENERT